MKVERTHGVLLFEAVEEDEDPPKWDEPFLGPTADPALPIEEDDCSRRVRTRDTWSLRMTRDRGGKDCR